MGLFGFIGKVVSNPVKAAGAAIGYAAEKIGQALNNDRIENWGTNLRARCQFGSKQWNKAASVTKTVDVHKELEKVKIGVTAQAKVIEDELIGVCISEVRSAIESLLPFVSSDELLLLNDSYAEKINEELSDLIMDYINPKLSLDDPNCTNVLNILDDRERMEASRRYQDRVMSGAEKSFKSECVRVKNRYVHTIVDLAERGLRTQEHDCQRLDQMLKKRLEQAMDESEIDIARAHILINIEKILLLQSLNNQIYVETPPANAKQKVTNAKQKVN